jgi:hypothetical protein
MGNPVACQFVKEAMILGAWIVEELERGRGDSFRFCRAKSRKFPLKKVCPSSLPIRGWGITGRTAELEFSL